MLKIRGVEQILGEIEAQTGEQIFNPIKATEAIMAEGATGSHVRKIFDDQSVKTLEYLSTVVNSVFNKN